MKTLTKSFYLIVLVSLLASACTSIDAQPESPTLNPTKTLSTNKIATGTPTVTPASNRTPSPTLFPEIPQFVESGWTSFTNANYIRDLVFDQQGNLWAAGNGGVVKWNLSDGTYVKFTSEHGLVSNNVQTIALAPDGALWFGTWDAGVSRYDGKTWKTYTTQHGLMSNAVSSIAVAPDNSLWFYGPGGTSHYLNGEWGGEKFSDEISFEDFSIAIEPDGTIWYGTPGGGVVSKQKEVQMHIETAHGLLSNYVTDIAIAPQGGVWIGTDEGLSYYDKVTNTWRNYTKDDGLPSQYIADILPISNDQIWVSFSENIKQHDAMRFEWFGMEIQNPGVAFLNGNKWTIFTQMDGLPSNEVLAMAKNSEGTLVCFGTYKDGIACYDQLNRNWRTYQTDDGLLDNHIRTIAISQSSIWIGHPTGISYYDGINWYRYTNADDLVDYGIWSLCTDSDGKLWVGTSNGISAFDGTTWTAYRDRQLFFASLSCSDQGIFAIVHDGLMQFDGNTWKVISHPQKNDDFLSDFMIASDGEMWISTQNNGLYYQNLQKEWAQFTQDDGLPSNHITTIGSAPNGNLWVGTNEGIAYFDGKEKWVSYTTKNGLAFNYIVTIFIDSQGIVIAGTLKGISIFNGDIWRTVTAIDGLTSNVVTDIVVKPDGEMWIATEAGLSRYIPNK